jgi:hypothetical protein
MPQCSAGRRRNDGLLEATQLSRGRGGCTIATLWPGLLLMAVASACVNPTHTAEHVARKGGLERLILTGAGYQHLAYERVGADGDLLVIFIDGDGRPWIDGGRRAAPDPTATVPLALELAAHTPESVLYLGRPCYFSVQRDTQCVPRTWTSDRYSAQMVATMLAATNEYLARHHFDRVLLVGYSGGGTLAVLMAAEVPHALGVVTIAGNLDPDSWTAFHRFLPLTGSLNPALQPPLPANLQEWHLVGGRDTNVPYQVARRYLERDAAARIWRYPNFDHACCWVDAWPAIFARLRADFRAPSRR